MRPLAPPKPALGGLMDQRLFLDRCGCRQPATLYRLSTGPGETGL